MKIQFLLIVASFCVAPAEAQTLFRTVNGAAGEQLGGAVIRAGDQNGDGFQDVLVGAPGRNAGTGAIHCVSGAYLATSTGQILLWSVLPTPGTTSGFGTSLAVIGQLVGNSAPDFLVGAPDDPSGTGALFLVDGAAHVVVKKWTPPFAGLQSVGLSVAGLSDIDLDGKPEVAAGGVMQNGDGAVMVIRGSDILGGGMTPALITSEPGFGTGLASLDLDGDGKLDIAIGSPLGGAAEAGRVFINSSTGASLAVYTGGIPGEHLGQSLDGAHDYDGDGKLDLIVGAPEWAEPGKGKTGRAVVLSGAKLLAQAAQPELFVLKPGIDNPVNMKTSTFFFGGAVRACPDVNNDGVGDLIVGMPGYFTQFPTLAIRGGAVLFSGATGARLCTVTGGTKDALGDAVLGALQDLDGDGFAEFLVAGSKCDNPATDSGILRCYKLFPTSPGTYCTAKVNSLGCTPAIGASGTPSVSSGAAFNVTCVNLLNKKSGVLIYSHKPQATAFQGGFLCMKTPIKRVGAQSSGGSQSGSDCTGTFSFDFKNQIQSGVDPTLVVGSEVFCQFWSRDPPAPSGTSLSNAVRFMINP